MVSASLTKGDLTRAAILDAGLGLASEAGLDALTIGELARRVGLSKSGLFRHFESKENLQLQVLERTAERFVELVVAPALKQPRGGPRLRALFENWLAWPEEAELPGGCPFVSAASELDDRPGPVRDRLVAYQRDWLETLATATRAGIAEGKLRAGLDVDQFVFEIFSLTLAYHHFRRLLRVPEAQARARRAFERLLASAEVGRPA
jgi:AcrR family transcriptional regulator